MPKIPKPVLIQDTREKKPWDFSGDIKFSEVKRQKLDYGDYSIEGLENVICIERKQNANELLSNFSNDKGRIIREFERMRSCMMKYIVIEQTLEEILTPSSYYVVSKGRMKGTNPRFAPAIVINALHEAAMCYNIHVIFAGPKAKSMAKGILLNAYSLHRKGRLHAQWDATEEAVGE